MGLRIAPRVNAGFGAPRAAYGLRGHNVAPGLSRALAGSMGAFEARRASPARIVGGATTSIT
jgi:hypothetical protein